MLDIFVIIGYCMFDFHSNKHINYGYKMFTFNICYHFTTLRVYNDAIIGQRIITVRSALLLGFQLLLMFFYILKIILFRT